MINIYLIVIYLTIYLFLYLNWSLGAYRAIHEATGENLIDAIMGNSNVSTDIVAGNPAFPWSVDLTFTSLIFPVSGEGTSTLDLSLSSVTNFIYIS